MRPLKIPQVCDSGHFMKKPELLVTLTRGHLRPQLEIIRAHTCSRPRFRVQGRHPPSHKKSPLALSSTKHQGNGSNGSPCSPRMEGHSPHSPPNPRSLKACPNCHKAPELPRPWIRGGLCCENGRVRLFKARIPPSHEDLPCGFRVAEIRTRLWKIGKCMCINMGQRRLQISTIE